MKTELILNTAQLIKLTDEVNHLNRDIRIIEFKPIPSSIGAENYLVILESGDTESIFFLGVAFALPAETRWGKLLKILKSWIGLK